MCADYNAVKRGKLRLKGSAGSKLRKKNKRKGSQLSKEQEYAEGELKHGEEVLWNTVPSPFFNLNYHLLRKMA